MNQFMPAGEQRSQRQGPAATQPSFHSEMLSIFPFPPPVRGVMWQKSTHLTSRLLSTMATAFPARNGVSPYLAQKGLKVSISGDTPGISVHLAKPRLGFKENNSKPVCEVYRCWIFTSCHCMDFQQNHSTWWGERTSGVGRGETR